MSTNQLQIGPQYRPTSADLRQTTSLLGTLCGTSHPAGTAPAAKERRRSDYSRRFFKTVDHSTEEGKSVRVSAWKMNEWVYRKEPCPLPTLARGLFTANVDGTSKNAVDTEIVARGYDKFFNIDEVRSTHWQWIEQNTTGPYEVTVKENGCFILVASLDGVDVMVTSKHVLLEQYTQQQSATEAISYPKDEQGAHPFIARSWLDRHLAKTGRTIRDLAAFLHENNVTMACELCDDDFEEHVLEYTGAARGLYLHGINHNLARLVTWKSTDVTAVAQYFGLHPVRFFTKDSPSAVRAFADEIRAAHSLEGRAVEGFVVRCQLRSPNGGAEAHSVHMFKIKYDEPYLMYREWREITRRILSNKQFTVRYALSNDYANWVKREKVQRPNLFKNYSHNRGIIATRKVFLADYAKQHPELSLDHIHGPDAAAVTAVTAGSADATVHEEPSTKTLAGNLLNPLAAADMLRRRVLLIPVATIACGKSTLGSALSRLFGFGHIQNDNITAKKRPGDKFNDAVWSAFGDHDVVYADRNNHLRAMRDSLTKYVHGLDPRVRIIGIHFRHSISGSRDINKYLTVTSDRVKLRGENHQSLTPGRTPNFMAVMHRFLREYQPLDNEANESDQLIDTVLELDPLADPMTNLVTTVEFLVQEGVGAQPQEDGRTTLKMPTIEEMEAALASAQSEKTTVIKHMNSRPSTTSNPAVKHDTAQQQRRNLSNIAKPTSAVSSFDLLRQIEGDDKDVEHDSEEDRVLASKTASIAVDISKQSKTAKFTNSKSAKMFGYFAVGLEAFDTARVAESIFVDNEDSLPAGAKSMIQALRYGAFAGARWITNPHITLAHSADGKDVNEVFDLYTALVDQAEEAAKTKDGLKIDMRVSAHADRLVWNGRTMALRVSSMKWAAAGEDSGKVSAEIIFGGPPFVFKRAPHVTLGLVGASSKAVESGAMVQLTLDAQDNYEKLESNGVWSVPIDLDLTGIVKKFRY
ncbi:hypothetical protein GQ42DRAFT_160844 [Ramicandelaber brevisporus]|nr:hypothetical protein GQ42DRAFT_160844 [Ramicandelaber brevisporus]